MNTTLERNFNVVVVKDTFFTRMINKTNLLILKCRDEKDVLNVLKYIDKRKDIELQYCTQYSKIDYKTYNKNAFSIQEKCPKDYPKWFGYSNAEVRKIGLDNFPDCKCLHDMKVEEMMN